MLNTSHHINSRHIFQCNPRLPSTLPNLHNNIRISHFNHHNPKPTHISHCHFNLNLNLSHHLYLLHHIYHINYIHHHTRQIKPLPHLLFNHHHYKHLMCYKHHHLIQQQSLHSSWPHQPHQLHHHHLTLQQPHQRLLNLLQRPSTHPHSLRHHTTYHALPSQHHPLHPHSALQEVFGATQIAHHHAHQNITAIQPFQPYPPLHHHKLHPDPGAALDHYVPHVLHYQDVEAPPPNPWLAHKHNPSLQTDKHHNHQQSPTTKLTLPSKTSLPLPLQNTLQSQLTVLPALHSSPTHISLPSIPQNRHFHHHPQHQHLQFQYSVDLTTCLLQHSNHPLIQHNWKSSNGSTATHKHLMSKMNP